MSSTVYININISYSMKISIKHLFLCVNFHRNLENHIIFTVNSLLTAIKTLHCNVFILKYWKKGYPKFCGDILSII